jgi:phosphate/sulfate permease
MSVDERGMSVWVWVGVGVGTFLLLSALAAIVVAAILGSISREIARLDAEPYAPEPRARPVRRPRALV